MTAVAVVTEAGCSVSLARIFLQHAQGFSAAAGQSLEAMEEPLRQIWAVGQAAWPQIQIPAKNFVQFLARQLPPEVVSPAELTSLRSGDLFLVCALGTGNPVAMAAFEADYMPEVRRTLLRLELPEPLIDDVIQMLYSHLLERQNAPREGLGLRRGYAGRGDLKGWLCVCAVHAAARQHRRERSEVSLEEVPETLLQEPQRTPEHAVLSGELKALFDAAFRAAVADLSSRERNLLRYHFLAGLSIDQIGALYRVHRATAARWVVGARKRLAHFTRKRIRASVPMHERSYFEIMALLRSQLTLNLAALLKQEATVEKLPGDESRED
jgi:RNA polymerase sigma-70 factor (ECF subfamily)